MRTLFKLAVGAAIAGALVNMAMRQMNQRQEGLGQGGAGRLPIPDDPPRGDTGFTLAELAADQGNAGVDPLGDGDDDRVRTAGEGRAGDKVLNS